ncbi:MAG: hypothetical protein ACFFG0_39000 [Candidatus Thorarchaeota archaeon]
MAKRQGVSIVIQGIKVTYIPSPPELARGDIYVNGTPTLSNQTIDDELILAEAMITALEANYTKKTRNYGGVSCECYSVYLLYFISEEIRVHTWVISWSVTDILEDPEEPSTGGGNEVPGYDIVFIVAIIVVISAVFILGFRKKLKT